MKFKRMISVIIAAAMLASICAVEVFASATESAALTFSDGGITETVAGSGYALAVGDVDGDGSMTVSDALRILRVAAKLSEGF